MTDFRVEIELSIRDIDYSFVKCIRYTFLYKNKNLLIVTTPTNNNVVNGFYPFINGNPFIKNSLSRLYYQKPHKVMLELTKLDIPATIKEQIVGHCIKYVNFYFKKSLFRRLQTYLYVY